ncbi:E3 ubiquitin-protein ligase UBR2 [Schistocerca nitens]|uniref:E3 ubiquitin-protein ligase UBR2 n=1 Tax=Schistocerca nitens TaxID=7011 RepID=UPI002117C499|nr:E3 ubiquitin-protein ligase UBR2 [Schistocerca nitens]
MDCEEFSLPDIDMEQPVLDEFPDSASKCVEVWTEKLEKGILSCAHFKEHWRIYVPRIYSPDPKGNCLDFNYDEAKAQEILFQPLERFICNGDPQEVFSALTQTANRSTVCGRVFKIGEPTYSCRECGMDSTCVLCVDCFKQSAHRNHKYKMGTSGGGGCCDCGDTEAWKSEPFCDIHAAGSQAGQEPVKCLPEDMAERVRATFSAVLKYAYQLLTVEHLRVPSDLSIKESEEGTLGLFDTDTHCTVLYNDETHTFEQVITTLSRVIKCSQKDAIDYVTNIDREGRAVVKCSTFPHCKELKAEIERFTARHGNRPLKVLVVHAHVIAHQVFAMELLEWLQKILGYGEGFRVVFSEVALELDHQESSIIEGILVRDSHLWKSARTHWHRLIISGLLMEYESKKAFAKLFTKTYNVVLKDFMRDDHDHAFSIASMSVQVFTVPTLAHYLIAEEDVLYILLNAFISECNRKCNKAGKLEFERNSSNGTFKRCQFILYDLRYLLSAKPTVWTDELRKGFLHGVTYLLNLLSMMQGMDQITRQVGQHMEYEPEWESAFNLHIKLAHVITLALEWCGTDRTVLIKAYRATLKKLHDPSQVGEVRELADHSAPCLIYDVSQQPVSIHLPLSRFLAGLHLHLEKFGLEFRSNEFKNIPKPTPELIIEPVLRTQVMISQVHAGMWRRNGYSLLNQLYFYHNVKCRSEMLDRDIILLQVGASLIESNEFLIHLLNKFNLLNWANPQFETNILRNPEEDSMRQTINLVEEFLGLLITIVSERYTPGVGKVTEDDKIKKEIIQQLCIKPLPHSELNKTLPEDVNHETGMERVIDQVAVFKKPAQGTGKGVYELKPEYYDQYDVFFYHYTREELSKSEEAQRKRRKALGELECCPPPVLPPLSEAFMMMANLLQCDVMLHIMKTVLERSINLRARSFSEAQLHKVLHLIGYALHEEEQKHYQYMVFVERAEKWGLENLIEELCGSARVEAHKDLLQWTLGKYRQVAAARKLGHVQPAPQPQHQEGVGQAEDSANEEKEWRAKMAAQKRAKIMAQMTAMQKNFMKENAKLFESALAESSSQKENVEMFMDVSEQSECQPIALGPKQTTRATTDRTHTCILCQEDQTVSAGGQALVVSAFVQKSTVLCTHRGLSEEYLEKMSEPLFLSASIGPAPFTGTCGHVMHSNCWEKYFENVLAKESRRPYRLRQPASFDIEKQEFLCPLCECLSNTPCPLVPPVGSLISNSQAALTNLSFEKWISGLHLALKYKKKISKTLRSMEKKQTDSASDSGGGTGEGGEEEEEDVQVMESLYYTCPIHQVVVELGEDGEAFASLFSRNNLRTEFSENLSTFILLFAQATFTKSLGSHPKYGDSRIVLMAWKSCAYTVHAMECLLRDTGKPLLGDLSSRQQDCLEGLIRLVAVLGTTWKFPDMISSHALRLLTIILESPHDEPCILDWDTFGVLLPLTLSLSSLFLTDGAVPIPTGGLQELYIFRLMLLCNIVKVLLTNDFESTEMSMEVEGEPDETEKLIGFIMDVRRAAGIASETNIQVKAVCRLVQEACIPFLRCCVLFYHFLTGVPAPQVLLEVGGDTFDNMCTYLGLNITLSELVCGDVNRDLAVRWCQHPKVQQYLSGASKYPFVKVPQPVNQLISLPVDYSELINTVSLFICPNSDREDSRNPTMCLVCGDMLCSQSYCCQTELNKTLVGACTYHAHECGAGVGIFLRVRECEILLLASPNRGCFMSPPYLDQYGETDQGLRRGNPLTLCPERYKKLQLLWLSHGIYEEITRHLESTTNIVTTQWQHL